MKYLPALAGLLSLLACVLWILALAGPWYHVQNKDGTEQRMGLYDSYREGKPRDHEYGKHIHKHQYDDNMLNDNMPTYVVHEELLQRDKYYGKNDDEYDDESRNKHEHRHKHKHGRHEKEEQEEEHGKKEEYPTFQPIIIQPSQPDNINAPTTQAPISSEPANTGDLQRVSGGGAGGGGFGGFGGGGGGYGGPMGGAGGGGMSTPGPTGMPAHHPIHVATPMPTSKHGRVYRQPHHDKDHDEDEEYESHHHKKHHDKHHDKHVDEDEEYERMSLNQIPEQQGVTQGNEHGRHLKKHPTKHEIERTNAFPYDETWVKAMKVLLYLAIIVSGIAALLQLLMAWTVGQKLHQGSWTTAPITAIIASTLIALAGVHGLITLFVLLSQRHELPKHGHYDYAHPLNIAATILSFISPLLFWFTLDTSRSKYESLIGEENVAGGRRKYASVE